MTRLGADREASERDTETMAGAIDRFRVRAAQPHGIIVAPKESTVQLPILADRPTSRHDFESHVARAKPGGLRRGRVETLQINIGRRCNQACLHCHVEAGPLRTETMGDATIDRVLTLLRDSPAVHTLDITGGAPELHPRFRDLVVAARALGRTVIDRCNLTVLLEPGMDDLAEFLAAHEVQIVASLPCYLKPNVDKQRGAGTYEASIEALRRLNALGYGRPGSSLSLTLVYNPGGASLPPPQESLERDYRVALARDHGVEFHRLIALTNMPIRRFDHALRREGAFEAYEDLLVRHFNPGTLPGVMCRTLVSVSWDGTLHDCDFNQMLEIPCGAGSSLRTVDDLDSLEPLTDRPIATASHCFGCTAGAGSSCGGALAP